MNKFRIYTKRNFHTWPSWHLVYEWEEDLSKNLNIPLKSSENIEFLFNSGYVRRLIRYMLGRSLIKLIFKILHFQTTTLVFELVPQSRFNFSTLKNTIPIIIDFWAKTDLDSFYKTYADCKLVCISSLEVYDFLIKKNCPLKIKHLPLSISDRYSLDVQNKFEKKYQILFAGRRNEFLWNCTIEFERKFPDIEYLYQEEIDGKLFYISNKKGNIGEIHTRDKYIDLLRSSKIALYSTPGMDGGEERTNGFNPVTPRFLELIAAGCHVFGRYPDNEETQYYELSELCPCVNSYNQFETILFTFINQEAPDLYKYSEYLKKHYTSTIAFQLKQYLNSF